MDILKKITILVLCIILYSCGGENKKISKITEDDIELQMIESFNDGFKSLKEGDILYAAKKFNEAELLFPQSIWAPKAALMAAYAYYSYDYYYDAIYELERFKKIYSTHPNLSYAEYLLAMCYYEKIISEKKDLEPLLKAKSLFRILIKKYPNTDFAIDAKFKIGLIDDQLAAKEMYIGKHYIKKEKWVPAINRFKTVLSDYETTIYVEEALHRLVEIYYKIGLIEESQKYASVLGYNYNSSLWYENSYTVFNKDYKKVIERKKKKLKKRNFIIRKFKSLLE